jgi:hypothetical protein
MKTMPLRESSGLCFIGRLLLATTVMAAALAAACAGGKPTEKQPVEIKYVGNCPDKANQALYTLVERGQKVVWQSVESDGSKKEDAVYKIIFDPFVGNTIDSDHTGRAESIPINMNAPQEVDYKYTVVSLDDKDGNPTCPPVDPRIRVKH